MGSRDAEGRSGWGPDVLPVGEERRGGRVVWKAELFSAVAVSTPGTYAKKSALCGCEQRSGFDRPLT